MINFEIINVLLNLDENENILKIIDIFYWNIYESWIKYCLILQQNIFKMIKHEFKIFKVVISKLLYLILKFLNKTIIVFFMISFDLN